MPIRTQYSPFKGDGGTWTLDTEQEKVCNLPVAQTIDVLIVKIRNSNGLEFCPMEQIEALIRELQS